MVSIQGGKHMQFTETTEPYTFIELKSLNLNENKTAEYSKLLCEFINTETDIDTGRIYIEFTNGKRHMWGWNNSTF